MYLQYFGLAELPFGLTPDTAFAFATDLMDEGTPGATGIATPQQQHRAALRELTRSGESQAAGGAGHHDGWSCWLESQGNHA